MTDTFATFDEALRATDKWVQRVVLIDGVVTPCTDVSTRHGTHSPVGQATLMLEAPLPPHVRLGARVEVQAGYPGQMARVFSGYIPDDESIFDRGGAWATVHARGWADLLTDPPASTLRWQGPVALKEVVRSIFRLVKIPLSLIDDITYDIGGTIELGISRFVDEGRVEISNTTGLLSWLTQTLDLFGYKLYDTPEGVVRVKRISGVPSETSVLSVTEGQIGYSYRRQRTTDGMATYWEVIGASYTDPDGVQQTIRTIPATVELTDVLPRGSRKATRSSSVLVTAFMAQRARQVLERDYGAPLTPVTWQTDIAPHIQPGDVAEVISPTVGASGRLWITSVEHSFGAGGLKTTTFTGTRGNGAPILSGQDCITISLRDAPIHLGDEHVPWYAVPRPSGTSIRLPFTVPDTYTSLKVTYLGHGANSMLLDADNTELNASKFIIWQNGEEVGSGTLTVMAEDYERRLPYGRDLSLWSRGVVAMPGRLEPGGAELEIVAGEDRGGIDDFEIRDVRLTACGVGQPIFVSEVAE